MVLVVLGKAAEDGFGEGLEGDGAVLAAGKIARGLTLELLVIVEERAIHGEFVLDDRAIHRERRAKRAVLVGAHHDLIVITVERRLRGGLVHDAGLGALAGGDDGNAGHL